MDTRNSVKDYRSLSYLIKLANDNTVHCHVNNVRRRYSAVLVDIKTAISTDSEPQMNPDDTVTDMTFEPTVN